MGRHSEEYVRGRQKGPESESTLTKLRKLFHLPSREDSDRVPEFGVSDDAITQEWISNIHQPLLDYGTSEGVYENWEYVVSCRDADDVSGFYALTPSAPGCEDNVAAAILADWFEYNEIDQNRRHLYEICVRRPGAQQWQGFAEGRE